MGGSVRAGGDGGGICVGGDVEAGESAKQSIGFPGLDLAQEGEGWILTFGNELYQIGVIKDEQRLAPGAGGDCFQVVECAANQIDLSSVRIQRDP
jgi:hypothetical protein